MEPVPIPDKGLPQPVRAWADDALPDLPRREGCPILGVGAATAEDAMTARQRVVIVGAGFGGVAAAKRLAGRDNIDVTLIDRRNYHLFQPLLYQVATAELSPADIAWPIRAIFTRSRNIAVVLAEVTGIDKAKREVITAAGRYPYDVLVLAPGAGNYYFGHDAWEPFAPGLKRIADATEIRQRILLAFERAETCDDSAEQRRLLNFVVVGGGPTGVEMAGAIADLARVALAKDFRRIDPAQARTILVEAGPRLLAGFDPALSDYTHRCLERMGVEIFRANPVRVITAAGVEVGGTFIPAATVVWAAGVKAHGPGEWLGLATDRGGRIAVGPDLAAPGEPDIFVIGDAARVAWEGETTVPGLAPAAKQQGRYVAERIVGRAAGREPPPPFRYRHAGNFATIGANAAVMDFGRLRLKGRLAWWLWGIAHIYFLINVRAATLVMLHWFWTYVTSKKGARLITGVPFRTTGEPP